jgi:DnaJ-class molecular chaperone
MKTMRALLPADDEEVCPECDGEGKVSKEYACQSCRGRGRNWYYEPLSEEDVRIRCPICKGKKYFYVKETCIACFGLGVKKKPIKYIIKS